MKKILLVAMTLLLSVSVAFGAISSGMDLGDLFLKNQVVFGDAGGAELDARLGGIFGTEKLRFSVGILELSSFFNNGQEVDGTTMPIAYGLPRFFVGAGYKINDAHRVAIGYGMNKKWDRTEEGTPGWLGHDVSVYYRGTFGANTITFATPIQFGNGTGTYKDADGNDKKLSDKISGLYIEPQLRWAGKLGALTQIRLYVPYHAYKHKDGDNSDPTNPTDQVSTAIGVQLRGYIQMATDPVNIQIRPRIAYNTAIEGNRSTPTAVVGADRREYAAGIDSQLSYDFEKPWNFNARLGLSLEAGNDIVSVYAEPFIRWDAKGAPKMSKTVSGVEVIRKEAFQAFGYFLPLEITIKANSNLEFVLGGWAGSTVWAGVPEVNNQLGFDGKVTWYF